MKEFYIRFISGILYALLILFALFSNQLTFSIVLTVFSILALIELTFHEHIFIYYIEKDVPHPQDEEA